MGPSKQGEYTVSFLNGHFEFLAQILFRGEAEEEALGKGKEGRVSGGRALPLFCSLDNSAQPQELKAPLSKANSLYRLAFTV